jgi:shikimate kinase
MKIFLVGMMGSGKSHWAQQLSAQYNMDWMDLDAEIEKETMLSITEIFETLGEDPFRNKETKALHNLAKHENIIIATGGGTPCFHNNMQWMNEHGITIWIDEEIDVLVERAMQQIEHRPAIKNLSAAEVHQLFSKRFIERKSFYNLAAHHLKDEAINKQSFAKIIQQYA